MTIVLYIHSLDLGGAEHAVVKLAEALKSRNYDILVVTNIRTEREYDLSVKIRRFVIGDYVPKLSRYTRVMTLRKILKHQNVQTIISFMFDANVVSLVATVGLKIKVIGTERSNPLYHNRGLLSSCLKLFFVYFDHFVVQNNVSRKYYQSIGLERLVVISNWINHPVIGFGNVINLNEDKNVVLYVGRLSDEKNVRQLIINCRSILLEKNDWVLIIVGDGNDRNNLRILAEDLGLYGKVKFTGPVKNLYDYYTKAEIICLTSKYEGFPNVLIEGMAYGCIPVCSNIMGLDEVINDGYNGFLCLDNDGFTERLSSLMSNESDRIDMSFNCIRTASRYTEDVVLKKWEKIIN